MKKLSDEVPSSRMSVLQSAQRLVSKLLFGHIALKRDDAGALCVTLDPRTPAEPDEGALMLAGLKNALDASPQSRRAFKHLHFLESALSARGLLALADLPPRVLLKALTQLDALAGDASEAGRKLLHDRLAAEIVARSPDPATRAKLAEGRASDFLASNKLQVSEGSISDFMRAAQPTRPGTP